MEIGWNPWGTLPHFLPQQPKHRGTHYLPSLAGNENEGGVTDGSETGVPRTLREQEDSEQPRMSSRWAISAWAFNRVRISLGRANSPPMRPGQPNSRYPSLTLVHDGAPDFQRGIVPQPPTGGSWEKRSPMRNLPRRPGDHLELVSFEAVGTLRALRREARERGLNPDTAISVVCERRLACMDLQALGLEEAFATIERAATATQPPLGMWAANLAYLRHLRDGDPLERVAHTPLDAPRAAVPIRLLDRLGRCEILTPLPRHGELAEALNWEAAALCAGQLIGEWANRIALAGCPSASASTR